MGARLLIVSGAVITAFGSTVAGSSAPKAAPSVGPPTSAHQAYQQQTYESGINGSGLVSVDSSRGQVQVERMDGVPVQVTATPGKGLMIDLGMMQKKLGADGKWVVLPDEGHTVVRVPMDLSTLRVSIPSAVGMSVSNGVTFADQHGHRLVVSTFGQGHASGGQF